MVFPASATSYDLYRERPFLWLSIMAITNRSTAKRELLDVEIRRIIGVRLILEPERNIDLLLGLMVYAAWYIEKVFPELLGFCAYYGIGPNTTFAESRS